MSRLLSIVQYVIVHDVSLQVHHVQYLQCKHLRILFHSARSVGVRYNVYGVHLCGSLGNIEQYRTSSNPSKSITILSNPSPAPPCGLAPYLKDSMYPWKAESQREVNQFPPYVTCKVFEGNDASPKSQQWTKSKSEIHKSDYVSSKQE